MAALRRRYSGVFGGKLKQATPTHCDPGITPERAYLAMPFQASEQMRLRTEALGCRFPHSA
jgi:hypothetical protein